MKYKFPIESERLKMRALTPDDVEVCSVFFINNPQLHFVGVKENKPPKEHAEFWLNRQFKRYEDYGYGMLGIIEKTTGEYIGQVGIIERDIEGEKFYEIGYAINPSHWGKGIASEAAIRMKDYFIEHNFDKKVISLIHVDNIGSQKVATRNGMYRWKEFTFEGDPCYIYRHDIT